MNKARSQNGSKTGGLERELHLKQGAKVMLTENIDIADRLTNGQLGTVTGFKFHQNSQTIASVYVKFQDNKTTIVNHAAKQ